MAASLAFVGQELGFETAAGLTSDGRGDSGRPVGGPANDFAALALDQNERRRRYAITAIGLGAVERPIRDRQQR
jgi:hypothetical protein